MIIKVLHLFNGSRPDLQWASTVKPLDGKVHIIQFHKLDGETPSIHKSGKSKIKT